MKPTFKITLDHLPFFYSRKPKCLSLNTLLKNVLLTCVLGTSAISATTEVVFGDGDTIIELDENGNYDYSSASILFESSWPSNPNVLIKGTGDQSVSFNNVDTAPKSGLCSMGGGSSVSLALDGLSSLSFTNNTQPRYFAYLSYSTESNLRFENIFSNIEISNNEGLWDVFYISSGGLQQREARSSLSFGNIGGNIVVSDNVSSDFTIYIKSGSYMDGKVEAIFDNIGGSVLFEKNRSGYGAGAIILSVGSVQYNSKKYSPETGESRLIFNNIGGGLTFRENLVTVSSGVGGAISMSTDARSGMTELTFSQIDGSGVSFIENTATSHGGAIYIGTGNDIDFTIVNCGDVLFENNKAGTVRDGRGGAVYLTSRSSSCYENGIKYSIKGMINMMLSADQGDITFTGNTHVEGLPNAIVLSGDTNLQFRAQEGRTIYFYDPINMFNSDEVSPEINTLDINKEDGYTGAVVFSGEGIANGFTQENYTSTILGDINIYNGTLLVEQGAVLGTVNRTDTITLKGGVMDIVGTDASAMSTIAAQNINFEGGSLRIGEHSRFDAVDIDMTQGLNVDLAYYLPAANTRAAVTMPHNGLQITADTLSMGGTLTIADTTDEYYYTNRFWAQDTDFILFNTTEVDAINGTFDAILSELTGTSVVADPYQYQGEWSLELLDGQLVAHWTATGDIEEIRPEMDGTAMLNTLWSTASNVQAMGRAGASQMGVHRFRYGKDHNIWGQGLADFSSHGRRGDRDGYDYNGGGYAVGMDHRMGKHFVTGFGVGQLKGDNRSRGYNIKTSQDTFMGMLYTNYNHQLNRKNNLDIQLIGVYGNTTNKSRTTYNRGVSQGKWDNDAWMLDLYATWTRDLGSNWSLTPYIGLEYTIANQDGFTETGYAARRFNSDKMRNLAIPVGMGVAKLVSFNNGMHWLNELKVSYVPDLYRKNPETQAEWLDQEFTWYAKGVAPVRNAARIEYNSRLQLSQRWSLYGGYMYEGRRNANYHQVNLGASYGF